MQFMPTIYKDQFFQMDPGNPPAFGTALTVQRAEFLDFDDNGQINPNSNDTFEGNLISRVWVNDSITINVAGIGNIQYFGVTFYFANGDPAVFTPNDGQALQDGTFVSSTFVNTSTQMPVGTFGPTCFTPGTQIDVPGGTCAVEDIVAGDLIETMDEGAQPVRLVLRQTVRAYGCFAPILFEAGSIGNERAFMVSPEHRMLIADWRTQLMMGCDEALVAAKHLVNGRDVRSVEGGVVEYIHLLFDRHQIVFGEGCPSESCLPDTGLAQQGCKQQAELLTLFPQLADHKCRTLAARTVARKIEATCLMAA
jgi:hypothetical protein